MRTQRGLRSQPSQPSPLAPVSLLKKGTGSASNSGLTWLDTQQLAVPVPFFSRLPVIRGEGVRG